VHIRPVEEILEQLAPLETLVRKTGGPREHEAFALLREHVARFARVSAAAGRG
jgi:hypothetical protein